MVKKFILPMKIPTDIEQICFINITYINIYIYRHRHVHKHIRTYIHIYNFVNLVEA